MSNCFFVTSSSELKFMLKIYLFSNMSLSPQIIAVVFTSVMLLCFNHKKLEGSSFSRSLFPDRCVGYKVCQPDKGRIKPSPRHIHLVLLFFVYMEKGNFMFYKRLTACYDCVYSCNSFKKFIWRHLEFHYQSLVYS